MEDVHDTLVRQIRKMARSQRLSMNRLADMAGMGRGGLSGIMNKTQSPTLNTLKKLAEALGVPVSQLLTSDEAQSKPGRSPDGQLPRGARGEIR